MAEEFHPGDLVVWYKPTEGGCYLVASTVVRVADDLVTILADDPDEEDPDPITRHVRPDSLELSRRAPEPGDDPVAEAQRLFAEGEEFADEEQDEEALGRFRAAWNLLPEPKEEQESACQILVAIADSFFHLGGKGHWHKCHGLLQRALRHWDLIGNPFVRLRLGQTLYELGNLREASNWMAMAYLQEGKGLFENDDPKYLTFIKEQLDPPPGGWPEGW
jgi:hypothetical protein